MSGNRNAHRGEQREIGWHWRAGSAVHSPGYRECGVRRSREADPQAADPYDGGGMMQVQSSVLFAVAGAVLSFTGTMSLSPPISAAKKPAIKATASAAPAAGAEPLF